MKTFTRIFLLVSVSALSVGCVAHMMQEMQTTHYKAPASGQLAPLRVQLASETGMAYVNMCHQNIWQLLGEIGDGRSIGSFKQRTPPRFITQSVPTGSELRFAVGFSEDPVPVPGMTTVGKECFNLVAFVPQPGVQYEADWSRLKDGCSFVVYRVTTTPAGKARVIDPTMKKHAAQRCAA